MYRLDMYSGASLELEQREGVCAVYRFDMYSGASLELEQREGVCAVCTG